MKIFYKNIWISKFIIINFSNKNSFYFSLTCLINHKNLLHLDLSQLVTLTIDSFVYEIVYYVNKTLIMFDYFTHYPRSVNAIISYISNEIILSTYKNE